ARSSEDYGFTIEGEVKVDIGKVVERSRGVASGMSRGIEYLFKKNNVKVISGHGRILAKGEVEVTDNQGSKEVLKTKNILLATGARANSLPFAPIDGDKIISYRQALVPDSVPSRLAVIGSGAIGSELAFFYRSMGSEVYLIEYLKNIVPLEDDDASAQLSRSFRKMGIKVMTSAQVKNVDVSGEGCKVLVETKKGEETIEVDKVLSAVGVVSNIENLGLEENNIVTERGKVKVDEFYHTSMEDVFAIGDIIATPALAHVASAEAICCVEKIAGLDPKPIDYTNIPACTYTSPEVASVGSTERELKEKGIEYKVGKFPFTASGKASASGERDGFVKLLIDKQSDKILGAHLVGANVTEMLAGIVTARSLGATAKDIMHSIHPHPTMSEAVMEAAAASHGEVIHV
ncbi:MAG: dihydrolipoyl dehydrogenase, partial [Bacteroidia bacterium]|nr:dihydrolipoyl dehydrogenase [Bacteroidia bacterium]